MTKSCLKTKNDEKNFVHIFFVSLSFVSRGSSETIVAGWLYQLCDTEQYFCKEDGTEPADGWNQLQSGEEQPLAYGKWLGFGKPELRFGNQSDF